VVATYATINTLDVLHDKVARSILPLQRCFGLLVAAAPWAHDE
jgi:hypothetical protein